MASIESLANSWRRATDGFELSYGAPRRRPNGIVSPSALGLALAKLESAWSDLGRSPASTTSAIDPIYVGTLIDQGDVEGRVHVSVQRHDGDHWIVFDVDASLWLSSGELPDPGWWQNDPRPLCQVQHSSKAEYSLSLGIVLIDAVPSVLRAAASVVAGEARHLYWFHRHRKVRLIESDSIDWFDERQLLWPVPHDTFFTPIVDQSPDER